jgi:putative transposase
VRSPQRRHGRTGNRRNVPEHRRCDRIPAWGIAPRKRGVKGSSHNAAEYFDDIDHGKFLSTEGATVPQLGASPQETTHIVDEPHRGGVSTTNVYILRRVAAQCISRHVLGRCPKLRYLRTFGANIFPNAGHGGTVVMPQSLSQVYLHLVFAVKGHRPLIDDAIRSELYAYMAAVLRDECQSPATIIGGVEDHIHILLRLSRTVTIARVVEMVKKRSSKWIKTKGEKYRLFEWQIGYGVFSVSKSGLPEVTKYVATQREHHQKQTFKDEFVVFLNKHGIEYDERYVWD